VSTVVACCGGYSLARRLKANASATSSWTRRRYLTFRLALRETREVEPNSTRLATLEAQLDKERTDIW
jgi:hypothetical protein